MSTISKISISVSLIAGAWTVIGNWIYPKLYYQCTSPKCSDSMLSLNLINVLLGVLLLISAIASIFGPRIIFALSSIISIAIAIIHFTIFNITGSFGISFWLGTIVYASSFILGILALRSRSKLSEQAHPLNLPVFG